MNPYDAENFYEDDEDSERLFRLFDDAVDAGTAGYTGPPVTHRWCFICDVLGAWPAWPFSSMVLAHLNRMARRKDRELSPPPGTMGS